MKGVQCSVCKSVWLSPAARQLVEMSGGCLRCDGPLQLLDDEETAIALQQQHAQGPVSGATQVSVPGDR
ncbi:MAG: hypothetical protein QOF58_4189 [Pseudonocardiales bacterium]|jgi:hypothetical protein|nr:hypothetical protein [Pseudonocardiales bacterium]